MTTKAPKETVEYAVLVEEISRPIRTTVERPRTTVKMNIPRTYRVTFGPLVPGSKGGSSEMAFRVYEGSKCRALIRGAVGFWTDDVILMNDEGEVLDPEKFYRASASERAF